MGSLTTPTALVLKGRFTDEARKYAPWQYMEALMPWFDDVNHDPEGVKEFYTEDFSWKTPHAEHIESIDGHGDGHAFDEGVPKIYSEPMKEWKHVNTVMIGIEAPDRWHVYCEMIMWANVNGEPVKDEPKVKDDDGREWELEIPVFYHLQLSKEADGPHGGLKMKYATMIKDTGLVNDKLDERGIGHKRSVNAT